MCVDVLRFLAILSKTVQTSKGNCKLFNVENL